MTTSSLETDQQLMALIRRGDERAFAELYHRFVALLLNVAFKRLNDKDLTEEVVQDLFVSIWLQREEITSIGSIQAYLLTALRNRIIDLYRRENRRAEYCDLSESALTVNSSEESIFYNDLLTAYEQQVTALPTKCQTVFTLYKQGRSINEIAELLDISPKTVESHLLKANRTLRHRLRDYALPVVVLLFFV